MAFPRLWLCAALTVFGGSLLLAPTDAYAAKRTAKSKHPSSSTQSKHSKKKGHDPEAEPQEEVMDVPPLVPAAPPPGPAASSEAKVHVIQAVPADVPARPEPVPAPEATVAAPVETSRPASAGTLTLSVNAGALVPFQFLKPGYLAGAEVRYRLPLLEQRLSVGLFGGFAQAAGVGPKLVPGRGYDPAFIQNASYVPFELTAGFELWRDSQRSLGAVAGYGLWWERATFLALGAQVTRSGFGHAAVAGLSFDQQLGPGSIGAQLRFRYGGGAPLGALGEVGSESVTSTSFLLSYAYPLSL